ncbi:hypothetical protein [Paractinoplanes toevensis]|uniref:Uncharacterized protein n=1 Tax=Paractinoplanes toevensis TaxID=571911 RepID=A0A919T6M8_9ACTN|nr:hypothetical protein [Actinoplanes toevensis]GIM90339.1 hypothetical protein Ato02nite_021320 [Actinoplanes toevensis]
MSLDTAMDAIARIDEGTARPADRLIADVFDRHSSDYWMSADVQLDRYDAERCVICRGPGGPECDTCTAGWDFEVARRSDV